MFKNLFHKENKQLKGSNVPHGEDISEVHLTYKAIPMTIEMRRRQMEEHLRRQYNIEKQKEGTLL